MSEAYLGPCQVSTIKLFCKNSPRLLVANFFRKKGLPSRNSQYNYECHSSLFQLIWIAFTNSVAMLENYFIFSLFQCFRSNFKKLSAMYVVTSNFTFVFNDNITLKTTLKFYQLNFLFNSQKSNKLTKKETCLKQNLILALPAPIPKEEKK